MSAANTMMTVEHPTQSTATSAAPRFSPGTFARITAALVACWAGPALTHQIGVDLILPPLLLALAAALVRGGRTALDQFVIAGATLFGLTCAAAFGFTVWPWGFHPVAVAGTGFTLLLAFAVATRRRPRYHRCFTMPDGFVLAGTLALLVLAVRQFFVRDTAGRLAIVAPSDDFSRHFLLTDAIAQVSGYGFMRGAEVREFMEPGKSIEAYPQGLHMLFALLDRFWRSSGVGNPDTVTEMDMMVWSLVFTFIAFGLVTLWAVRRVAGPELTGWKSAVVLGAALAYIFFGDPVTLLTGGFPNEIAALGCFAILLALVARPLHRTREQVLVFAALLLSIAFTYYLFLPPAGLIVLVWLARYRRRVLRHRLVFVLSIALAGLGLIPVAANSVANRVGQFALTGFVSTTNRHLLLAMALVIAAALLTRRALRSWAWRSLLVGFAASAVLVAAIAAIQVRTVGGTLYYYERAFHLIMMCVLVGLAALTRLLPSVSLAGHVGWRARARALAPLALLAMAPFALLGIVLDPVEPARGGSDGTALVRGRLGLSKTSLRSALWASKQYPDSDRVVVDLTGRDWDNAYNTLYGSTLRRDYGSTVQWYVFLFPNGEKRTLDDLERKVLATDKPMLFLVSDRTARFLYVDNRKTPQNSFYKATNDTGDDRAMTNVEAAEYLARTYPDRVRVDHVPAQR